MDWNVYWWEAGKQFLIGDVRRIVDLCGPSGKYFTVRYTRSRRPKTLTYVCRWPEFVKSAASIVRGSTPEKTSLR